MEHPNISSLRKDYRNATLNETDVQANPFEQFRIWFHQAMEAKLPEPNAMTLATANKKGIPSARMVLLKGFDENGFVFYTNYFSHKGQDLDENPHAALVFYWHELERQIRIEGSVKKVSKKESESYYHSRPKESRIGAWASPQSEKIDDRQIIEDMYAELSQSLADTEPPYPDFWGGYRIKPKRIEFWQGRTSRLHDRILYEKTKKGNWKISRLAP